MATKKTAKNLKFEEALAELEAAVEKLERGDLPLEDAIEEFQKGTELSKICLEKLNTAKAAVKKLIVDPEREDSYEEEEFADLETEDAEGDAEEDE